MSESYIDAKKRGDQGSGPTISLFASPVGDFALARECVSIGLEKRFRANACGVRKRGWRGSYFGPDFNFAITRSIIWAETF